MVSVESIAARLRDERTVYREAAPLARIDFGKIVLIDLASWNTAISTGL
jgi:hypothetical protein